VNVATTECGAIRHRNERPAPVPSVDNARMAKTPVDRANKRPDAAIDELERELDGLSGVREPLDASAVDGFLCGVLLDR
jgi:hypothetical protein